MTSRKCSWTYRWVTSIMNHQTNLTGQHSSLCLQMLVIYITRPTASFHMSLQNTDSTLQLGLLMIPVTLSPWLSSCLFQYLFIQIVVCLIYFFRNLKQLVCSTGCFCLNTVECLFSHIDLHSAAWIYDIHPAADWLPSWSRRQKGQMLAICIDITHISTA